MAGAGSFKSTWKGMSTGKMSPTHYTQVVLNERPIADITPATFRIEKVPFSLKPGAGEILVQVNWLSLDPAMRGWLRDTRSYLPPVQIGEVMRSVGLATVVEVGEGAKLQPGDVVQCMPGGSPQYRCSFGNCAYGKVGRSLLS
jgi:NADPH-dependent curcumin reductase CurA